MLVHLSLIVRVCHNQQFALTSYVSKPIEICFSRVIRRETAKDVVTRYAFALPLGTLHVPSLVSEEYSMLRQAPKRVNL